MFGLFRVYLAVAVVAHHLLRVPAVGDAAVFAFFTLSGFLMTHIMARSYGYGPEGFAAYLFNRVLRLFPLYWVSIALSLFVILVVGDTFALAFNRSIFVPPDAASWLMNVTMVFPSIYPSHIEPRLFPIVWTLSVEFLYYILIGLGATRTVISSWAMLALALSYHLFGIATGQDFNFHYFSIFAGALPFAAGGLTYHYRDAIGGALGRYATAMLGLHMAVLALGAAAYAADVSLLHHAQDGRASLGVDLANLAGTVVVSALTIGALYRPASFVIGQRLDTALGKYSYPIYLLHLQTAMLIGKLVFGHRVWGANVAGLAGFVLTLAATLGLSRILVRFVEPRIDALRDRVKRDRRSAQSGGRQAMLAVPMAASDPAS